MISVILATLNDERRLSGTLGALVPAAVDGLVRQVIIADGGSTDATLEIADDAGAVLVDGGLAAACATAREAWLLVLDAGTRLEPGWEPLAHAHIMQSSSRAGRVMPAGGGWLSGLLRPRAGLGVLAPKALVGGGWRTVAELERSLRPAKLAIRAVAEA
jgi:glycosyltransferase involved in cell wall biosynthesis